MCESLSQECYMHHFIDFSQLSCYCIQLIIWIWNLEQLSNTLKVSPDPGLLGSRAHALTCCSSLAIHPSPVQGSGKVLQSWLVWDSWPLISPQNTDKSRHVGKYVVNHCLFLFSELKNNWTLRVRNWVPTTSADMAKLQVEDDKWLLEKANFPKWFCVLQFPLICFGGLYGIPCKLNPLSAAC